MLHDNGVGGKRSLEKIALRIAWYCKVNHFQIKTDFAMPEHDASQIQIRCPKCGQRFSVDHDLTGRMVECGACEHRFRLNDDSLVKQKKFYPGERRDPHLVQYASKPYTAFSAPSHMHTAEYAVAPPMGRFEPVPFGKVLVGIVGVAMMILTALVLILAGAQGAMLDGVTANRRMVIAGFAAIIGAIMIIYANPRAQVKAGIFAIMGALTLILLPVYFKEGSQALVRSKPILDDDASNVAPLSPVDEKRGELRAEVGYGPMKTALAEAGTKRKVIGIWMKGLQESNSEIVERYLMRMSGAGDASHLYPRNPRHYLLVLVDPQISFEEMASQCGRMGEVDQTDNELQIISVLVDNKRFAERPMNKLTEKSDGSFYEFNLMEMEGMDIRRINEALVRLSLAEPMQSRDDVIKRMIDLLPMADKEMLTNLSKALIVWSDGKDGAPEGVMKVAKEHYVSMKTLPVETVEFLTKWPQAEIYPIMDQLWLGGPVEWEAIYAKSGAPAEDYIIKHLCEGENRQRMSAARICARVGGPKSVEALEAAMKINADLELQTSFRNAIEAIQKRP